MPVTATAIFDYTFNQTKTATFGRTLSFGANFKTTLALADGTGSGQGNRMYVADTTINASANLDLDLSGSLTDAFGDACVFTKVKHVYVEVKSDSVATSVTVCGGSNPFVGPLADASDKEVVTKGQGPLMWIKQDNSGWAVTNGSNDNLRIANTDSSNAAKVRVVIIGVNS